MRKIYIVLHDFGDSSEAVAAFFKESLAIQHAEEMEKIEGDSYWVSEIPLKDWKPEYLGVDTMG